jgi:esterase/lipase superfamily enzyme
MTGSVIRLAWAVALVFGLAAAHDSAQAQAQVFIQKVENKALKGTAYSRLRGLTYEACEQACLRDTRCLAMEHYRGGGLLKRAPSCALFSAIERSADAKTSDVGYKRRSVAAGDGARALRKSAPSGGSAPPGPVFGNAYRKPAPAARPEEPPAMRGVRPPPPPVAVPQVEVRRVPPPAAAPAPAPAPAPAREAAPPASVSRSIRPQSAPRARAAPPAGPAIEAVPPPPAAAAPGPDDRFHIVPVFYGTDRNQVKQEARIGYANDRAKRLEMGRALVSVPLDHKVPNIERPRAWTIPYIGTIQIEKEDPNKHFTVRDIRVLSKAELLALVKERLRASQGFRGQSIVFIHGYNMSFDDALYRTAQISYDLQFDGAAFAYSWPSGGGLASYIYDRDSAQGAERYLYEFLQMVQNETGSESINIIAHSMGNQMLLQVLRSLRLRAPDAMARINQIILAAPDVDRDAFEALAGEITGLGRGITLYAASNDRALDASRLVAGNKPRAGDVPAGGPVIVAGIDTIDITRLSTGYLAMHHSGYAEHSDLITDIGQIIRSGTRPWTGRLKAYRPVSIPSGTYWRYEN